MQQLTYAPTAFYSTFSRPFVYSVKLLLSLILLQAPMFCAGSFSIVYHLEHYWKCSRKTDVGETSSDPHTLHSSFCPLALSWPNILQ